VRETHIDRGTEAEIEVLVDGHIHQVQHPNRTTLLLAESEIGLIGINVLHTGTATHIGGRRSPILQGNHIRHRVLPTQKPVITPDRNNLNPHSIDRAIIRWIVNPNEGVPGAHLLQTAREAAPDTININVVPRALEVASGLAFRLVLKAIIVFLARARVRGQPISSLSFTLIGEEISHPLLFTHAIPAQGLRPALREHHPTHVLNHIPRLSVLENPRLIQTDHRTTQRRVAKDVLPPNRLGEETDLHLDLLPSLTTPILDPWTVNIHPVEAMGTGDNKDHL